MAEASTYVTNETPIVALPHGKYECSETRPRPLGSCKASNDDLLAFGCLDLEPVICSNSRQILAMGALGHDPSKPLPSASWKNFVPKVARCWLNAISLCFGKMALRRFLRLISESPRRSCPS